MKMKLGSNLILEPPSVEKEEKYRCRIVDLDDHFFCIDYPIDTTTNRTVFFINGTSLRATYVDELNNVYAFQTEVLEKQKGQIPMIKLSFPSDAEIFKIQRRDFVRVTTSLPIAIEFQQEKFQLVSENISAGGTAVVLNRDVPFEIGQEVFLHIPLPFKNGEIKTVSTTAIVTRIRERGEQKLLSFQFITIKDFEKQQIVRFCFERQLSLRKKGL